MGAAADQDFFSVFLDQKIMLMQKTVGNKFFSAFLRQSVSGIGICRNPIIAGIQGQSGCRFCFVIYKAKPVGGPNCRINADVFFGTIMKVAKSMTADIDRGNAVFFKKGHQTAAVVIVSVGKYGKVSLGQVDSQSCCIGKKSICLPEIKQDFMVIGFYKKA